MGPRVDIGANKDLDKTSTVVISFIKTIKK